MGRLLNPWRAVVATGSVSLNMECLVHSPPDGSVPFGTVVDGLDDFCERGLREALEEANPRIRVRAQSVVRDLVLVAANSAQPRNQDLSFTAVAIRTRWELTSPHAKEIPVPVLHTNLIVRTLAVLNEAPVDHCGSINCDIAAVGIRDGTAKVCKLPHLRRSVNLESISSSDSEGFLHEAMAIKGVQRGAGELLAVFRRVPLAMVSRVCFLEDRGVLLYTVPPSREPSRTRVHDLAAVRDRTTQKTHLVAHRTVYRTVFLHRGGRSHP